MKNALLLATSSDDATVILWCLREGGYATVTVGNHSKNKDLKFSPLCKRFYEIPECYTFEKRSQEIIPFLRNVVNKENIDVIIPSGFESIKFLSKYQGELKVFTKVIPVPSLENINILHNKYTFSLFCRDNDISHPNTYLLKDIREIKERGISLDFPILTKPLNMSGSSGIYKFDTIDNLYNYLVDENKKRDDLFPLLLQSYIPGEDIDFNGFATNGNLNAWTVQRFIEVPRKKEKPLKWTQFVKKQDVLEIGRKIVQETRYSGPIHIDLRIDARGGTIKTIEVNPRFWGSLLYSICDGINFVDVAIKSTFDPGYTAMPKYSNRIWGTPHRIPFLAFKRRSFGFVKQGFKHTFFQIKYMLLNFLFSLVVSTKKLFLKRKEYGSLYQ